LETTIYTDTYQATLLALKERREQFERELRLFLDREMRRFSQDTGLFIKDIDIDIDEVKTYGEPTRYILTAIRCDLDLP
jgi:hypothetical protein